MTEDLHAVITARLDELQANAERAQANAPGPWGYLAPSMEIVDLSLDPVADVNSDPIGYYLTDWDPTTVLRGLAEDRDILRRHQQVPLDDEDCRCGWVLAECPELLSLARRHGVQP